MRTNWTIGTLAAMGLAVMMAVPLQAEPTYYNGVSSYEPGNGYDAPIFRQFAFVEGVVTQYHVLTPEAFPTDDRISSAYQFPACQTLRPVFSKLDPIPGHPIGETDSPTRQVVDVVLSTGCAVQPTSEEEVAALAVAATPRPMWVNAPIIPEQFVEWTDEQLFNGPPFRPRLAAYQDGSEVQFITYEASWYPTWTGSNFPSQDADVFIISYGALFRPGFTILNVAAGTPHHESVTSYSPIWAANCIVDADDPKCMVSVNMQDPSYYQCRSVFECLQMENSNGNQVQVRAAPTFTHINCPMVSADLNGDDYIDAWEEFYFPNFWVNGPIIV